MPAIQTPPGKILQLEMENFKSYKGHQLVGPFKDFTAIIGPNGSGKSNLMDAISFVLGVRTGQLRGSQLKDLIYAFDDRDKEQKGRRAFVRLVYQMDDGVELHFTRTITSAGGSEYRIDNRVVNLDEYNGKLRSLGILVKARNFLVFQVIASSPFRDLTLSFYFCFVSMNDSGGLMSISFLVEPYRFCALSWILNLTKTFHPKM